MVAPIAVTMVAANMLVDMFAVVCVGIGVGTSAVVVVSQSVAVE